MADTLINKNTEYSTANNPVAITDTLSSGEVLTILSLSIVNTHASTDTTFDLWIDAATDGYIYLNQPLPSDSTFMHNAKIVLKQGELLKFETSAAVECNMIVSALKQTSVSTSSGSDYLDNMISHVTNTAQLVVTPNNTTDVKTVLSITVCNTSSTDVKFNLGLSVGGGGGFFYRRQSLPGGATFEHTDKVVCEANDEIFYSADPSVTATDVIVSFLRQVP